MCQNVLIKVIIINYFGLYFLKEIAHLRGKIEQAGYEIIHTYNVTLLRGKMYRLEMECVIPYPVTIYCNLITGFQKRQHPASATPVEREFQ